MRADISLVPSTGTLSRGDTVSQAELDQIAPGGGVQSALRLLVGVIEVPGGVAIKGGRPSQASQQLGPGNFVDPATGLTQVALPDDAIDSVTVLPNPYAVEFGRFSSGLVLIQTRRGADMWKMRVNNLDPSFRTQRGRPLAIIGISSFSPRVEIGGPLIKGRVFLQQAMQHRYRTNDVPSRPQDELRRSYRFSSFTRVDANLSLRHSLVAIGGTFPSRSTLTTLGTFIPPDATVDTEGRVDTIAVTERSLLSETAFLETTGEINGYHGHVRPRRSDPMELLPETTLGHFFNRQDRTTSTYQLVQTLTGSRTARGGLHIYKGGIDVLHSRFSGESVSAPVLIRRTDSTLARRLDFTPGGSQAISSTDLALFAQDRWQPNSRWFIEFGGRLDRDGVIGRFSVTPRVGTAVLLNASGAAVLRGGYGLFYERTPSAAGVFEQYESATETRYLPDGITASGPSQFFPHVTVPDLRTPRSATWGLVYDQRFNPRWSVHVGAIDRRGSNELIVEPVSVASGSELRLSSTGRSRYRPGAGFNVSYVRSQLVGVLEWRTGLPCSVVDESLDFVGARNSERFPNYFRLDLGIEHRFRIGRYRPWIGVRADNALDSFLPSDVQANLSSPAFRAFDNSQYRQFRIQVRFER